MHLRCSAQVADIRRVAGEDSLQALGAALVAAFLRTPEGRERQPTVGLCPSVGCGGVLRRPIDPASAAVYQPCRACGNEVCVVCGAMNDARHAGVSCAAYRRLSGTQGVADMVEELYLQGQAFVEAEWPTRGDSRLIPRHFIHRNPGLTSACVAFQRFNAGVARTGVRDFRTSLGFFAWHGTSSQAIVPICETGFDPTRRSGQVSGRGEYFGVDPNVSLDYCRGGSNMIVAFLLRGPHLKTERRFCHVVDNPVDWSAAYCVPVLVVGFGNPRPAPPPFPPGRYDVAHEWQSPFRWHWKVCVGTTLLEARTGGFGDRG